MITSYLTDESLKRLWKLTNKRNKTLYWFIPTFDRLSAKWIENNVRRLNLVER